MFSRRSQRDSFRRYLEGLLLGQERPKTLTALANAEPVTGAHNASVQTLQRFLSESCWDAQKVNARRKQQLLACQFTRPRPEGALVIDETGDRKDGKKTAHIGRQYLANLGKVDNGVVSVTSLYADAYVYYPLEVEPYTPAHWFARGKNDPAFRTKPQIALELVQQEVAAGLPFRAVVADCFYGDNDEFRTGLMRMAGGPVGFVLGLKRSHCWWHREGEVGSLLEAAQGAGWQSAEQTGQWQSVVRGFTDGHEELWWALEVKAGGFGPEKPMRVVIATTDPATLPEPSTWFLITNLPSPNRKHSPASQVRPLSTADLCEVVRLYGLRTWIEQGYKQLKHALGWAQYQVRHDQSIRRHWVLVMCVFSFVWWTRFRGQQGQTRQDHAQMREDMQMREDRENGDGSEAIGKVKGLSVLTQGGEKGRVYLAREICPPLLADGATVGSFLAGALEVAPSYLAGVELGARPTVARTAGAIASKPTARTRSLPLR